MPRENSFDVFLTEEQYQRAVRVGTLRYTESIKRGCQQAYGAGGYDLPTDIIGAAGELAYCLYTNQPWSESVNTFKAPDVGSNVQVRTTGRLNGRLIVRKKDKDDDLFVLVITNGRSFRIAGSIMGKDAKQDCFIYAPNGRPPAWFVDQEHLTGVADKRLQIEKSCPECGGKGQVFLEDLNMSIKCSTCGGSDIPIGKEEMCPECQGEGRIYIESHDLYIECLVCGETGRLNSKIFKILKAAEV